MSDLLMSLQGTINLATRNTASSPARPGAFRHVGTAIYIRFTNFIIR